MAVDPPFDYGEMPSNQEELYATVAGNVAALLDGCSFHQGPFDDHVSLSLSFSFV